MCVYSVLLFILKFTWLGSHRMWTCDRASTGRTEGRVKMLLTYRELLRGDACVHHSFVHGLERVKIWRCNEHHIRHELRCFQYFQSLRRDTGGHVTAASRHIESRNTEEISFQNISHFLIDVRSLPRIPKTLWGPSTPLTCGLTSRMQVRPVPTTLWMDSIFVPYRFASYSPCSRKRPAFTSTSISILEVKW